MQDTDLFAGPGAPLVAFIAGAVLLVLGRRLYWLFVGVVGFFLATSLLGGLLDLEPGSLRFVFAVLAGLAGALLAVAVQKIAVALAGFLVGAWVVAGVLGLDLASLNAAQGVVLLIAGVLAAVLAVGVFDLALIVLSSLAGASLILDAAGAGGGLAVLLLVLLTLAGITIQAGFTARARSARG